MVRFYFDSTRSELERICSLGSIGPGDFIAVKELTGYMEPDDVTGEFILESLYALSPFASHYPASIYFIHIFYILSGISYFS